MRAALALLLVARARAGGSLSAEVQALRKQTFKCEFGDTPEQRPLADGATRGWVAFTKQRSGSRWFVNTVVGRSGPHFGQRVNEIALGGLGKQRLDPTRDHKGCYGDKPSKRCSCALRQAYALRAHDRKHNPDHTQGFKWMLPSHVSDLTPVIASTCDLRLQWIIMLRRNILRRKISAAANKLTTSSHVSNETHAKELRENFKPTIETENLYESISGEHHEMLSLIEKFKHLCKGDFHVDERVHYYEDLVDSNPASDEHWGKVLYQLGGWNTSNVTKIREWVGDWHAVNGTVIVHGRHPVKDVIANYKAVAKVLRGTEFEWMLD